jgi:hypothetical protein
MRLARNDWRCEQKQSGDEMGESNH